MRHLALVLVMVVSYTLLGCGGGGGGGGTFDPDPDPDPSPENMSITTQVSAMVAETLTGLTFVFTDGGVFHAALAGAETTVTFDTATDTTITVTLATEGQMAQGEIVFPSCDSSDILSGTCGPYNITVTDSDFPTATGPQVDDVLELENWRLRASKQDCASGVSATLSVSDVTFLAVTSETLDLDGSRLSPLICAGA